MILQVTDAPLDINSNGLSEGKLINIKRTLIKSNATTLITLKDNDESKLYLENIFMPIYNTLENYEGSGDSIRLLTCDSLSIWLLRCTQILQELGKKERLDDSEIFLLSNINNNISNQIAERLFDFVVDFWNDSGSPLSNALKELFTKLTIFLYNFRNSDLVHSPFSDSQKVFDSWCLRTLKTIPHTKRVLYFLVMNLAKIVDAKLVLENSPNFLEDSLIQMKLNAFSNSIAKCLAAIFEKLYKTMKSTLVEKESDTILPFEISWVYTWESQIINALTNHDLRRNVQLYLLPLMFKIPANPRTVHKYFVRQILSLSVPQRNCKKFKVNESDFKMSLYLSCLKIGQELLIEEEPFDGLDPVINICQLKELLQNNNKSIRLTAVTILIGNSKNSKPIKSYIYDMLYDILEIYFVDDDPDARNDFFSLCRYFILRIRDSNYAANKSINSLESKIIIANRKINDPANVNDEKTKDLLRTFNNLKHSFEVQILEGKSFIHKLIQKCKSEIVPGMTYQRLNIAYRIIQVLITSGIDSNVDKKYYDKSYLAYPYSMNMYTDEFVRLYVDNITNNFDEIREFSIQVLTMAPNLNESNNNEASFNSMDSLVKKAINVLQNIQGKQSDSGARLLQFVTSYNSQNNIHSQNEKNIDLLILELEKNINEAKSDFGVAVTKYSVHGLYKGLAVIVENYKFTEENKPNKNSRKPKKKDIMKEKDVKAETLVISEKLVQIWKSRINKILSLLLINWELTRDILSTDSPEGNVPDELKDKDIRQTQQISPFSQILSNYAWRAAKDSSLLLKQFLLRIPLVILSDSMILEISDLVLAQLSSVNHKGAFYSIYPTFEECCNRCFRGGLVLSTFPEKWLSRNLLLIKEKSTYIIRRSAGLPFLISIILKAKLESLGKIKVNENQTTLFKETFSFLLDIANSPVSDSEYTIDGNIELPQVHAFNCIKQLFIEAQLSAVSSFYVGDALTLSFKAMKSPIWVIRNCAVMLFAALENKLFGSKKIGDIIVPYSARLFFSRFKGIKTVMISNFIDLLLDQSSSRKSNIENIFPILTILSRLEPTNNHNNDLAEFEPHVIETLGLAQFKIREMAARSVPSLVFEHDLTNLSRKLIKLIEENLKKEKINYNLIHGLCLALKETFNKLQKLFSVINESSTQEQIIDTQVCKQFFSVIMVFTNFHDSPMIFKVMIDILSIILFLNGISHFCVEKNFDIHKLLGNKFLTIDSSLTAKNLEGPNQLLIENISLFLLNYGLFLEDRKFLETFIPLSILSNSYRVRIMVCTFLATNFEKLHLSEQSIKQLNNDVWAMLDDPIESSYVKSYGLVLLKILLSNSRESEFDVKQVEILFEFASSEQSEDVRSTAVQAIGPLVGKILALGDEKLFCFANKWLEIIKKYISGDFVLDLRYCCTLSLISMLNVVLDNLQVVYQTSIVAEALFLLYCQLTDGDDIIRESSSKFLSLKFLEYGESEYVAMHIENSFFEVYFDVFGVEAMCQLCSYIISNYKECDLFIEQYTKFKQEHKLFDMEKENLYKVEFVQYSKIITLICSHSTQFENCEQIQNIVNIFSRDLEKFSFFVEKQEFDEILGWCSNEFVFNYFKLQQSNAILLEKAGVHRDIIYKYRKALTEKHIHESLRV